MANKAYNIENDVIQNGSKKRITSKRCYTENSTNQYWLFSQKTCNTLSTGKKREKCTHYRKNEAGSVPAPQWCSHKTVRNRTKNILLCIVSDWLDTLRHDLTPDFILRQMYQPFQYFSLCFKGSKAKSYHHTCGCDSLTWNPALNLLANRWCIWR